MSDETTPPTPPPLPLTPPAEPTPVVPSSAPTPVPVPPVASPPLPFVPAPSLPNAPSATWSLVLGILSFVCGGFITAIPAIICGHIGRSAVRKSNGKLGGSGLATAGLVLGYIALVLNILIIPAILIPVVLKARQRAVEASSQPVSFDRKEVIASDDLSRVKIPADWAEMPGLNQQASLQVGNGKMEQYLMVLTEAKPDGGDMTLEKHHQMTRDAMLKKLQNSSGTDPVSLTIGGNHALQDELSGTQNGTDVVFIHTTVEGDEHFHQVLAWTLKSQWEKNKKVLRQVTETFRGKK